ncbi:hypothetical protein [Botryobacter ruber]|uniref:hypothetical protein n=1 Tax=Botryobacter ruber TaxID=2171629 RepID=UPI000F6490CB|nr:hypothetical protein [Botryobacter ruber]
MDTNGARYRILNGKPVSIEDANKYDLSKIIELIYTSDYEISSDNGKLLSLTRRNNIAIGNAIPGHEEAKAYEDGSHQLLWMSTQQKVKIISELLLLASNDKLKVATSFISIHGLSFTLLKRTFLLSPLLFLAGMIGKEFISVSIKSLSDYFSLGTFILNILGLT